jgi:hypothetical protein
MGRITGLRRWAESPVEAAIELLGAVDVGDGKGDHFELHVESWQAGSFDGGFVSHLGQNGNGNLLWFGLGGQSD